MTDNNKEISTEQEFIFSDEQFDKMAAEQKAERMKSLRRHKLPAKLTLEASLNALTKSELEDIQYNLNLPMATNINRVKKADMVAEILPEVVKFSQRWFVSIFEDQKAIFDFVCQHQGMAGELKIEDYRLDYLRGIGVMFCGMSDGKLLWYMPEEIQAEYTKINNGAFQQMVSLNDEIARLSAGLIFYYGVMDYDQLYARVGELIDTEVEFSDFIGVLFNGGCWCKNLVVGQHELKNVDLINSQLDFIDIPYNKAWDAGEESYVESTGAYRALAQFFMNKCSLDVLQAAETVHTINIIMQNGYGMQEIVGFLKDRKLIVTDLDETQELYGLIKRYNRTLPMWALKGHTFEELDDMPRPTTVRVGKKIGRNDPCPCGSGKKYKNCCLDKNY